MKARSPILHTDPFTSPITKPRHKQTSRPKPYFFQPHVIRPLSTRPQGLQKKLLLLAMDWKREKDPPISLAQLSILANLQRHNLNVIHKSWSVNDPKFDIKEVIKFVNLHINECTDIALGAYIWHEPHTQELLRALKENFKGRIILGGPQVSYVKKGIEDFYQQAHVFIRGYAEEALAQLLLSDKEQPPIVGIHYAGQADAGLSAKASLEQLPSPFLYGLIKPGKFIRWETQRGCPFRCAFCQHRESDISMVRRQFSSSRIMDEIDWILANPIIQDIAVLDPIFNSGPLYLAILKKYIEGKYTGKIALQCRLEMVTDDFLNAVETLNQTAHVVLEFGLQTIHRKEAQAVERPNNMQKVRHILTETRKRNIATEVSLIFGLPHQTLNSFLETIQFCKDLEVPTIYAYPLMLLRGTPLYEKKNALGLIESSDNNLRIDRIQENIPVVISSPSFSYEEWQKMATAAESLDEYNQVNRQNSLNNNRINLKV